MWFSYLLFPYSYTRTAFMVQTTKITMRRGRVDFSLQVSVCECGLRWSGMLMEYHKGTSLWNRDTEEAEGRGTGAGKKNQRAGACGFRQS